MENGYYFFHKTIVDFEDTHQTSDRQTDQQLRFYTFRPPEGWKVKIDLNSETPPSRNFWVLNPNLKSVLGIFKILLILAIFGLKLLIFWEILKLSSELAKTTK